MIGPTPDPVPVAAVEGASDIHRFSRPALAASLGIHVVVIAIAGFLEVRSDPPEPVDPEQSVEVEVIVEIPAKEVGIPRLDGVDADAASQARKSTVVRLAPVAPSEAVPSPPAPAVAARPSVGLSAQPSPPPAQPRQVEPETAATARAAPIAAAPLTAEALRLAKAQGAPPAAPEPAPAPAEARVAALPAPPAPPSPPPSPVAPAGPAPASAVAIPEPAKVAAAPALASRNTPASVSPAAPAIAEASRPVPPQPPQQPEAPSAAPTAAEVAAPAGQASLTAVAEAKVQDKPTVAVSGEEPSVLAASADPVAAENVVQESQRPEPLAAEETGSPQTAEAAVAQTPPAPTLAAVEAESAPPVEVAKPPAPPAVVATNELPVQATEPLRAPAVPAEDLSALTAAETEPPAVAAIAPALPQPLQLEARAPALGTPAVQARAEPTPASAPSAAPSPAPPSVDREAPQTIVPGPSVPAAAPAEVAAPAVAQAPEPVQPAGPPPIPVQSAAQSLTTAAATPPALPSALQPLDPSTEIEGLIQSYDCARISSRFQMMDGNVAVAGHVRSEADRRDLLAKLAEVPGVTKVEGADLHIVQEPYCRVLTLLARADLMRSEEQRSRTADLPDPVQAGVRRLSGGTPLKLQLKAPDFDGHVYVDYFTMDGQVYHLLPRVSIDDNFVSAGEQFGIGGVNDPSGAVTIGPPYGLDMVVAIGTSAPLFKKLRPVAEDAAGYLAALDAAIAGARAEHADLKIEYVYHLIYTTDPPPS